MDPTPVDTTLPASPLANTPAARRTRVTAAAHPVVETNRFWRLAVQRPGAGRAARFNDLQALVQQVISSDDVALFEAVEMGVPTTTVDLIAGATNEPVGRVLEMLGVAATTYKRKGGAQQALPDAAGQRVMGLLRVMATLQRALEESGDPERMATFDLGAWMAQWLKEPLAELRNKTPAEMLKNAEGQRALEQIIERMRGGLPA